MATAGYMSRATNLTNDELIEPLIRATRGVSYDTIVGTGLSGTIFAARVAPVIGKHFAIVRKADDESTHSRRRVEGNVGGKYIFADDLISSGNTFRHAFTSMKTEHGNCEFVGAYLYQTLSIDFIPAEQMGHEYGAWLDSLIFGGPRLGPNRPDPWDKPRLAPANGWDPEVAKTIPLPPLSHLALSYSDCGRPTFWDLDSSYRLRQDDPRIQDLMHRVSEGLGHRYGLFVGTTVEFALRQIDNAQWLKTDVSTPVVG